MRKDNEPKNLRFHEVAPEYVRNFTRMAVSRKISIEEFPCLSETQITAHNRLNIVGAIRATEQAASPCVDCSHAYRDSMLSEGRCRRPGLSISLNEKGDVQVQIGEPIVLRFDF